MFQTTKNSIGRLLLNIAILIPMFIAGTAAYAHGNSGAVYAMTNAADGNEIVVYKRTKNGKLRYTDRYPTEGLGTGGDAPFESVDALASQNSLILSEDNRLLFSVNAISNTISVFPVHRKDNSLELIDLVHSGGDFPVSLTLHEDLLYVLNSGGEGNIPGFN